MDSKIIEKKLKKLNADTPAQFGIMTPQHMVEHLTVTVKIAYNRIKIPEFEPNEKQKFQKRALLNSDMEFPRGVVAPGMNAEDLMPLRSSNLDEAKQQVLDSITAYNTYFELDTDGTTVHPRFGKLTYAEWEIFHLKHFEHHFKQFGIW
jgi:oxepin-CoA hydrolase/3-oxo-5,6-dehydrosuberyl-CoA semialdehyde dehydrogenase